MNLVPKILQEYREAAMSGLLRFSPELGFTAEDLADLPDAFPPCVIRDGKIARADGLPLEWEQYDLLGEGFPATLTEDGELKMSPRPTPAHEEKAANLFTLLKHFSTCQRAGKAYLGPELRIRPYRRTLAPDVMFFKNPKPEWKQESATDDSSPKHPREAVEGSLTRLRLDRVDVYQLHMPDPAVPFEASCWTKPVGRCWVKTEQS